MNLKRLFFPIYLIALACYAQPNTEIYLFDLMMEGDSISLKNKINISNNEGYDNQPSFYNDSIVLFSSTRNGQTDVRTYQIHNGQKEWLTDTPIGSEYSPLQIPNSNDLSFIRLDTTGLQRLYRLDPKKKTSQIILKDAKVGYHLWHGPDLLLHTVLKDDRMDLMINDLKEQTNRILHKNVGRNLLKIPNSKRISYIAKTDGKNVLTSIDVQTNDVDSITTTRTIEDFAWAPNGLLLAGHNNQLVALRPGTLEQWRVVRTFTDKDINTITRLAINNEGNKLAMVAEVSPENIVQKQVDSYNAKDLEAFVNCYAEDVWVGQFPLDTFYTGRTQMLQNYTSYLESVESTSVKVVSRIVKGNKVIDQELADDNGKQSHQVAIYEVKDGLIASMNFIFDAEGNDPEPVVQKQLEAYNARDIDAFMATYTDAITLYEYPNRQTGKGKSDMRGSYQAFFESTPDLHCEIKNRIVIGNKVIDEENLTINGQNFSAVAIYEVIDGKIDKVTFVR